MCDSFITAKQLKQQNQYQDCKNFLYILSLRANNVSWRNQFSAYLNNHKNKTHVHKIKTEQIKPKQTKNSNTKPHRPACSTSHSTIFHSLAEQSTVSQYSILFFFGPEEINAQKKRRHTERTTITRKEVRKLYRNFVKED